MLCDLVHVPGQPTLLNAHLPACLLQPATAAWQALFRLDPEKLLEVVEHVNVCKEWAGIVKVRQGAGMGGGSEV